MYRRVAFPLAQRIVRPASLAVLRALRASEHASADTLRRHRDEHLRRIVRWAYDTVPAYRRRFDEAGVQPEQIRTAEDLALLPILTKRDLRTHGTAFHSSRIEPERHWINFTSGSTGEPLRTVRDSATKPVGQATWWHSLERCGVHPADPMLNMMVVNQPWIRPWRRRAGILLGARALPVAAVVLRDLSQIDAVVRDWRPRIITGQPHRLALLARMVVDGDVRFGGRPDAVMYHGTVITDDMREMIARAFGPRLHSRYATTELVPTIAYTCERGAFHVNAHHVIVEIVDGPLGAPTGNPANRGRVVVTDLTNFAAPHLRYEVGDLATWDDPAPCPCGRTWPRLASIDGRQTEAARTRDGRELSQPIFANHMLAVVRDLPDVVWEYQFRQHTWDELELCVVPRPAYTPDHGQRLARAVEDLTRGAFRVRVTVVDAIPAAPSGKRALLVSLLDEPAASRR